MVPTLGWSLGGLRNCGLWGPGLGPESGGLRAEAHRAWGNVGQGQVALRTYYQTLEHDTEAKAHTEQASAGPSPSKPTINSSDLGEDNPV